MRNSKCKTSFVFSLSLLLFLLVLILPTTFNTGSSSLFGRIIFAATQLQDKTNFVSTINDTGPNAQLVYQTESINIPQSVGTFIWYIVDEAHENTATQPWKHVSDHNAIYIPTNLVIPQGTAIAFLDADAPWDTPHPHTINVIDSSNKIVYTTGKLDYTNSSAAKVIPVGHYTVQDTKYPWMKGNLTIAPNPDKSVGNLVMGGFYTPTNQVANNKDNDGGTHLGWLGYYKEQFAKNGFNILDTFNFHYATCKYCPGGFWPDQKSADHTLILYSTSQSLSDALNKLSKMVWENVYI
ncbi:MAG TPA: hypothetical protein VH796_16870 [Nitrososphaeraceae archaeon]